MDENFHGATPSTSPPESLPYPASDLPRSPHSPDETRESTNQPVLPKKEHGFLEDVFGEKANAFTLRDSQFCGDETQLVFEQDIDLLRNKEGKRAIIRFQSTEGKMVALLEIVCAVFWVFYVPFAVSFRMHYEFIGDMRGMVLEITMDVMNLLFLTVRCFTSYCDVNSGKEYCARSSICKMVTQEWSFFWSMIGCLPFISVFMPLMRQCTVSDLKVDAVGIAPLIDFAIVLIKCGRCTKIVHTPASFMSLEYNFWFGLARLFAMVILFGHVIACIWHLSIFYCNDLNRIIAMHIPNEEDRTSLSWYFIALRDGLFMVAAQDRQGLAKDGEIVTLCVIGPMAAFFFAYVFGNTTVLITRSLALQTQHCSHMAFIRSAMKSLGLPYELQKRIITYHHYLHVHHNPTAYDALFTGLSVNLLIELKLFLFRQLFMEKASFFRHCHPDLIQKIVVGLKECTYSPGDIIILKGWIGDSMFFIVKGKCDVLNQNNVPVAVLQSGDHFGEIALIYEQERNATVRAATYCVLGKLEKCAYDLIMVDYEEERDKMRLIAEERIAEMKNRAKDVMPQMKVVLAQEEDTGQPDVIELGSATTSTALNRVRQSILKVSHMAQSLRDNLNPSRKSMRNSRNENIFSLEQTQTIVEGDESGAVTSDSLSIDLPRRSESRTTENLSAELRKGDIRTRESLSLDIRKGDIRTRESLGDLLRRSEAKKDSNSSRSQVEMSMSLSSLEWNKIAQRNKSPGPPFVEQKPIMFGFLGDPQASPVGDSRSDRRVLKDIVEMMEAMRADIRRISLKLNAMSEPDEASPMSSSKLQSCRLPRIDHKTVEDEKASGDAARSSSFVQMDPLS